MRKVYKNFIRSIVAAGCICLLTGCGSVKSYSVTETMVNAEEISEEQFLEILSPEKVVLCQVVEPNEVIAFIQNEKMEEWEDVREIPVQAELQYIIISYEKVTENFWLEKGAPEINIGKYALYEDNGDFYVEDVFEGYSGYCRIPASAGEYIMKVARNGSDILYKNDIFASWGINDFGIENREEAVLKKPDKIFKSENDDGYHLYSAEELAKVSKEQKLEIFDQNSELVCTMKDLGEIADFYNQIKRETWLEIERLPEEKSNICEITIYQLERHTREKNLIENEKLILFEAQNRYYIHDIIPGYSEGIDDMESFYSIPNDIGNYIITTLQLYKRNAV
ncbi:MAG: hypothetical protein K2K90_15770 [Lachnospiraceae bacterium]|nr:hypothetical protein [Lachnospiraceae bacterium]